MSLPVFKTGAPANPGGRVRFPSASARDLALPRGFATVEGWCDARRKPNTAAKEVTEERSC